MAFTTRLKTLANRALGVASLRIDSLTAQKAEENRLAALDEAGWFDRPAFPVPEVFRNAGFGPLLEAVKVHESRYEAFERADTNDVGYSFENSYFGSPDAEVLYALVRLLAPGRVIEVGSGNSTKLFRQAVRDAGLTTQLVSIDPSPRTEIKGLTDRLISHPVEHVLDEDGVFGSLASGDVLFIDSSHMLSPGNDCVALYLKVIPALPSGVVVHVHDVFLPYEYPQAWVRDLGLAWNEQYLVQTMLVSGQGFEVLWPGHYLQRTCAEFPTWFPRAGTRPSTSLWLRKR